MSFLLDQPDVAAVPAPATTKQAQEKILFAFHECDRAQFFPSHHDFSRADGTSSWVDTAPLASGNRWADFLLEAKPTAIVSCWSTPALPAELLLKDSFPLRYICHTTGTVKNKVPREFVAGGGLLTNWGNVISHNVAEHGLLLILASMRKMAGWRPLVTSSQDGNNALKLKTSSLRGKKVGLHGIGNVALELIRLLQPFDAECHAYSQNVPASYIREKGCIPAGSLKELFRECDVIVECEALTPQSIRSVTEEHFRLMPEGAVFVNVGRGAVVDEPALARVAAEGRIFVGLDVFETEPMPVTSPLLNMENVILSPHIAGPTGDWFHRCGDYAMENIDRYLAGLPLNGIVTLEIYDRTT